MPDEPVIKRSELKRRLDRWVQHVEKTGTAPAVETRGAEPLFELSDGEANMLLEAVWWLLAEKGSDRNSLALEDKELWGDYEALRTRLQAG